MDQVVVVGQGRLVGAQETRGGVVVPLLLGNHLAHYLAHLVHYLVGNCLAHYLAHQLAQVQVLVLAWPLLLLGRGGACVVVAPSCRRAGALPARQHTRKAHTDACQQHTRATSTTLH